MIFLNTKIWHSPSTSKQIIGNTTQLSDGWKKKYIYRDVRFFHGALQLFDFVDVKKLPELLKE